MFNNEDDTTTEASFIISWNIARAKHSYSDGEFVKKNIAEDIAVLDPTNRKSQRLASQTPVSRHTVRKKKGGSVLMLKTNCKEIWQMPLRSV